MTRLTWLFFLIAGSVPQAMGFWFAEIQRRSSVHLFPVLAEIRGYTFAEDDRDGRRSLHYALHVHYLADGLPRSGAATLEEAGPDPKWSPSEVEKWPVGRVITVWVEPGKMSLVRADPRPLLLPYLLVLGGMILLIPLTPWPVRLPADTPELQERESLWMRHVFRAFWFAVGVAAAVHMAVQPGTPSVAAVATFSVYFALGLPPSEWLWRKIFAYACAVPSEK